MKQIKIRDKTFRTCLQVCYDCSIEEFYRTFRSLWKWDWKKPRWRYETPNWWQSNLIWVKDITDIPCIVHELMHFIYRVLERKWFTLNNETDELYAYLFEFYFDKILHYKLKSKKEIKKFL